MLLCLFLSVYIYSSNIYSITIPISTFISTHNKEYKDIYIYIAVRIYNSMLTMNGEKRQSDIIPKLKRIQPFTNKYEVSFMKVFPQMAFSSFYMNP